MPKRVRFLFNGSFFIYLLIILLAALKILLPVHSNSQHFEGTLIDRLVEKASTSLNDSLPVYIYKKSKDSIRQQIIEENKDNLSVGSGWQLFSVGTSRYDDRGKASFFLRLSGYTIDPNADFYTEKGTNFIESTEWKPTENNVFNGTSRKIKTNIKVIRDDKLQENVQVLIPISEGSHSFIIFLFGLLALVVVVLSLYALIMVPLRMLLNITKGEVFNDENIGGFSILAGYLLGFAAFSFLLILILHWAFLKRIPEPVHFSYYASFMEQCNWIIAGLIALLFTRAFRKGFDLQAEQDLTV